MNAATLASEYVHSQFAAAASSPVCWASTKVLGAGGNEHALDEIIAEAIDSNDDAKTAFFELLTHPAAAKLRELVATHHAGKFAQDIAHELSNNPTEH